VVKIEGGWSPSPGGAPSVDKNTQWTFRPAGNDGVNLSFQEKGSETYKFQTWYEKGSKITIHKNGMSVVEPDGREEGYTSNVPVSVNSGPVYHSAYDENLDSSILTIHTKSGSNTIDYTTTF
jgi:hypothetical protein